MGHHRGSVMAYCHPSLGSNRAFVVPLRAPPPGTSAAYDARAKPVVAGQVARFQSMKQLQAFMIRDLTEVQAQSESP
jgi:hypothetical protein